MEVHNFIIIKSSLFAKSRLNLFTGLMSALFFSFCFYAFMYLIREIFRITSITVDYDLWILTDDEVKFYNRFFAFIAVIFGQSLFFSFLFEKPRRFNSGKNFMVIKMINDQRGLNSFFISWFSKLALFYALIFGFTNECGFYAFSFYPRYKILFGLIIIVLFLQTWVTIRRVEKNKSLLWMFYSVLIVSSLSGILSEVNFIDYKKINAIAADKNISLKYRLELPRVPVYDEFRVNRYLTGDIYFVIDRQSGSEVPDLYFENSEVDFETLNVKINDFRNRFSEPDIFFISMRLHIDASVKMKYVNQLKTALLKSDIHTIKYAVLPLKTEVDIRFYRNYIFSRKLFSDNYDNNFKGMIASMKKNNRLYEIVQHDDGKCYINNEFIPENKLKFYFESKLTENYKNTAIYHVNPNIPFNEYLKIITLYQQAINELRDIYLLKESGVTSEEADCDIMKRVTDLIRSNLIEVSGI